MNKNNSTPKRLVGRSQPKRPKLDFSMGSSSSPNKLKTSSNNSLLRNISILNDMQGVQCTSTPYWDDDDDFPTDMLEKVCEIADLSQAMVNREQKESKSDFKQVYKRSISERDFEENSSNLTKNEEGLKLENEKLMENIKIREGEVQILRSQLKQVQEAKQSETLNNLKLIKEMEKSHKEKLEAAQKEFEAAKTELKFKELELKSLTEKCQQLESNTSKIRLIEPQLSQLDCRKTLVSFKSKVNFEMLDATKERPLSFEFPIQVPHEGRKFGTIICPEYFQYGEEPSVTSLYKFKSRCGFHVSSLDFDKREKYIWTGLPKQAVFIRDTYYAVSNLFSFENFSDKIAEETVRNLLDDSLKILKFQLELFLFLEKLQEKNCEYDDSDYALLENEEEVSVITMKRLLSGKKISKEECGLEARRVLGMISSLILSSELVLRIAIEKGLVSLMKDLVVSVGNLRKPTRYTGILAGITLILRRILESNCLEKDVMCTLNEIIEEIIFARPKLDVLTLVVETLAAANNHIDFVLALCKKGSVESCALYMDSKLHQAMFFTKDACPLKLLCTQIMGLSCIPTNREMRLNAARAVTKWVNRMIDVPFCQEIKWLPTASFSESEDKCFDVTECFIYLLNCCLNDYFLISNFRDEDSERRRRDILSVVGDGCMLFRRILKCDQRLLHESCHNIRFATLLNDLRCQISFRKDQKEVVDWIVQLLNNHDYYNKPNASKFPTDESNSYEDVIDALKLDDNLIIF